MRVDSYVLAGYTNPIKQGSFGIRKDNVLDAFELFYEELIFSNPTIDRIRRIRPTAVTK
jgi:hypothetical protein